MSAPTTKKPTPQQRAIEKKRALWRDLRVSRAYDDFDPDNLDSEKYGQHFDSLSDEEWALVWKHVISASGDKPLPDEMRVRELVDDAAYSSGWFLGYGELHISHADYHRFADDKHRFLRKTQQFRSAMAEFFGDPPFDQKEPYDPWGC